MKRLANSLAIARHETALILNDVPPLVVLVVMPLVLILFLKNGVVTPAMGSSGSDQAVPGVAVLFGFIVVATIGFSFFQEHGWGTWERLRTTSLSTPALLVGKTAPFVVLSFVQLCVLFGIGWIVLDLSATGSLIAFFGLTLAFAITVSTLAVMLVAISTTVQQMTTVANLVAVLFAGIGGSFAPSSTFPTWARLAAHATPQFWAIEGFKDVLVGHASLADVVPNIAMLLIFSVLFTVVVLARFDRSATKQALA